MGNVYLIGQDSDTWTDPHIEQDLLALFARDDSTPFSRWVIDRLMRGYHQVIGKHFKVCPFHILFFPPNSSTHPLPRSHLVTCLRMIESSAVLGQKPENAEWAANTVEYSHAGVKRVTSFVAVVLASMLPVVCIIILYFIGSDIYRLITIALFTVAFSGSCYLTTSGTLVDIFMATSAYVAYQMLSKVMQLWLTLLGSFAAVQVVFVSTNGNAKGNGV